jgi:hypothetical protein
MTKAERMYALIDARAASGKTVVAYCAEIGISRAKYNYWQLKRKRAAAGDSTGFVRLQAPKEQTPAAEALRLTLPGGLLLSVADGSLGRLADLLLQMDRRYAEF